MGLLERIREEHDELRRTMSHLTSADLEPIERRRALASFIAGYAAHEEAEERTVYRVLEVGEHRAMALEGLEQHRIVRALLAELRDLDDENERWLPKLVVIKGLLESHMLLEEGLLLPTLIEGLDEESRSDLEGRFSMPKEAILTGRATQPARPWTGRRNI